MFRRQTPPGRERGRERERERERGRLERLSLAFYTHPCTLACEILDIIYKRKIPVHDGECTEMHAHSHFDGKTSPLALHSSHISIPLKTPHRSYTKYFVLSLFSAHSVVVQYKTLGKTKMPIVVA